MIVYLCISATDGSVVGLDLSVNLQRVIDGWSAGGDSRWRFGRSLHEEKRIDEPHGFPGDGDGRLVVSG